MQTTKLSKYTTLSQSTTMNSISQIIQRTGSSRLQLQWRHDFIAFGRSFQAVIEPSHITFCNNFIIRKALNYTGGLLLKIIPYDNLILGEVPVSPISCDR
ncbi:hypothetical protein CDAR_194941 [Caerostris darwini]|uniref:Uncharacterized protein n=1 Tax=Caerostris darwini TaxID=1538125 RepID=A0AAV4X9H9_9ARAC|nr:hypothetical protein CDAR_194941 [Caerostris darwini]